MTRPKPPNWDFGYLAHPSLDVLSPMASLVAATSCDRIDLVDLERASGLLRFRTARDGVVIFERTPGTGDRFRLEAAQFWCDAALVLERGYDDVLAELKR